MTLVARQHESFPAPRPPSRDPCTKELPRARGQRQPRFSRLPALLTVVTVAGVLSTALHQQPQGGPTKRGLAVYVENNSHSAGRLWEADVAHVGGRPGWTRRRVSGAGVWQSCWGRRRSGAFVASDQWCWHRSPRRPPTRIPRLPGHRQTPAKETRPDRGGWEFQSSARSARRSIGRAWDRPTPHPEIKGVRTVSTA